MRLQTPLRISFSGWLLLAVCPLLADAGDPAPAKTHYFSLDVAPLLESFQADQIVSERSLPQAAWYRMDSQPRIVLPAGSEAYLLAPEQRGNDFVGYRIVGSKPDGEPMEGTLFALRDAPDSADQKVLAKLNFRVNGDVDAESDRETFLLAKGRHFERLWSEQIAGAAMFRHLAIESLGRIGLEATSSGPSWPFRRRDNVDDTIQLISGGRAVSENLQLDRQLPTSTDQGEQVALSGVNGITVREIDWSTRLLGGETELDPLAELIPHDQHVLFTPSFETFAGLIADADRLARPAVQWLEPESRQTDVLTFYQQQIGLPLNAWVRQAGAVLVEEVAVTGSDPYFRTGTDVAVLMSSKQPEILAKSIETMIEGQAAKRQHVARLQHNVDGHRVTEWSTRNRDFCSFAVEIERTVVVANSLTQVSRIIAAATGETPTLASLDEYRFFRQRYRRDADDESALLVISDPTIRRWCGPEWRIAASRRTRARATMAEVTMRHADELITEPRDHSLPITTPEKAPDAGRMWLRADGVHSMEYGTLQFQRPIVEMDMKFASKEEVELYEGWRRQYERQWRNAFDPIAVKLTMNDGEFLADVSVIPLLLRSRYRWWVDWVGSARLRQGSGDHHPEALASLQIAINLQSTPMTFARTLLSQQGGGVDMLSWIDGSVSVYLDRDSEWKERVARQREFGNPEDLARETPVGLFIPSRNNLRMTAFVIALRGFLDQAAPNMIRWETGQHQELTYVSGTFVENTPIGNAEDLPRLYYVTTSEGLTLSLNRNVITRAIDRHLARKKAASDREADVTPDRPDADAEGPTDPHRFEPQLAATLRGEGAATMSRANYRFSFQRMASLSWSNLPILNYLRRQYPDRDPRQVYQALLGERLVDPAGGKYRWVEKFQTYESSIYGHHLAPRLGPALSPTVRPGDLIESQLSFDDGGLRAQMRFVPEK